MANICCCWELGAGVGHVVNLLPIAHELRKRGHKIKWIIPAATQASDLLTKENFDISILPINRPVGAIAAPKTFAEILCGVGYLDPINLTAAVARWRTSFIEFQADLIITEYAPTALLASKSLRLSSVKLGPSFTFPPPQTPMPSFRIWEKVAQSKLGSLEKKVLSTVNQVLEHFQVEQISNLYLMLQTNDTFLTTFPEFDEYGKRTDTEYLGTPASYSGGATVNWPTAEGKKVFAYLKSDFDNLISTLEALGSTFLPTVVCVLGASQTLVELYSRPQLKVVNYLVDFNDVIDNADVVIAHGTGTIAAALLAGIPTITLAMNIEQHIRGRIAQQLAVGSNYSSAQSSGTLVETVLAIVNNDAYKMHARNFAQKYSDYNQSTLTARISDRCEKILAQV